MRNDEFDKVAHLCATLRPDEQKWVVKSLGVNYIHSSDAIAKGLQTCAFRSDVIEGQSFDLHVRLFLFDRKAECIRV